MYETETIQLTPEAAPPGTIIVNRSHDGALLRIDAWHDTAVDVTGWKGTDLDGMEGPGVEFKGRSELYGLTVEKVVERASTDEEEDSLSNLIAKYGISGEDEPSEEDNLPREEPELPGEHELPKEEPEPPEEDDLSKGEVEPLEEDSLREHEPEPVGGHDLPEEQEEGALRTGPYTGREGSKKAWVYTTSWPKKALRPSGPRLMRRPLSSESSMRLMHFAVMVGTLTLSPVTLLLVGRPPRLKRKYWLMTPLRKQ